MNKGKVYVVGIGPGRAEEMTFRAENALKESDCIAGYTVYCDLVRDRYGEKEYIETPMTGEEERVKSAFMKASEGKTVSIICSGDAGVYGLAGLACSEAADHEDIAIEIIPGVSAALSGAALLGAPLIHDFCLISMSDRLTPMDKIEKRLKFAAMADMVIVIYNPESRSRRGYLKHACEILLSEISGDRICGIARNIGREGESHEILTLNELKDAEADMFSTVFIGNSSTMKRSDMMITMRGYKSERN